MMNTSDFFKKKKNSIKNCDKSYVFFYCKLKYFCFVFWKKKWPNLYIKKLKKKALRYPASKTTDLNHGL